MARRRKKSKTKVKCTAPDFGAVFARIRKILDSACVAVIDGEASAFQDYITKFIRANQARPRDTSKEDYSATAKVRRRAGFVFPTPRGQLLSGSARYEARKLREGYGSTHVIRTEKYIDELHVRGYVNFENYQYSRKVGFDPASRYRHEFSFNSLAKVLEYGIVRPVSRTLTDKDGNVTKQTGFVKVAARPHWRPAHLWYRATRHLHVAAKLQKVVMSRIRSRKWRVR